jgi:AraC-like DNA-binding protein
LLVEYVKSSVAGIPIRLSRGINPRDRVGVCSRMHLHDELEILVGFSGIMDIQFENENIDLEKGDVIIVNRRVPHATNYKTPYSESLLLQFREEKLRLGEFENMNKYLAFMLSSGEKEYYYFKKDDPKAREIADIVNKMYKENTEREKNFDIYIRGYLDILLGTLYRYNLLNDMSEHYDSESIRRIWKAIEYIGEKYNEDISIDTLSSLLELNTEYFCRLFKKATGVTAVEYINHVRIFKAENLLTTTNKSVLEISMSVGFSSVGYFNRVFKRYRGTTPSSYRGIIYAKNKLM